MSAEIARGDTTPIHAASRSSVSLGEDLAFAKDERPKSDPPRRRMGFHEGACGDSTRQISPQRVMTLVTLVVSVSSARIVPSPPRHTFCLEHADYACIDRRRDTLIRIFVQPRLPRSRSQNMTRKVWISQSRSHPRTSAPVPEWHHQASRHSRRRRKRRAVQL